MIVKFYDFSPLRSAGALCLFFIAQLLVCADIFCSPAAYQDKNGFFSIAVPEGWVTEEYSNADRSKVQIRSLDGKAAVGIIAVLDSDNVASLFLIKKEFVEDHRVRFPEGRFDLSREMWCGFDILRVVYEIPMVVTEEFYYVFADGVRYDFVYGAGSMEDFERYKQAALEMFCSLKLTRRMQEKP